MTSRASDLAELGLTDDDDVDDAKIRKAYLLMSLSRHPDKGGTTESFQLLVAAYERLRSNSYHESTATAAQDHDSDQDAYYEDEANFWYDEHYNFFGRAWGYDFDDEMQYENYFENWRREKAKARARQRRENLKQGYDYRDKKASPRDAKCMFCGVNKPIRKREARKNGLNWDEYSAHPNGYKTCWVCKDNHISVMTESMACNRFAKKLDYTKPSTTTGRDYRPVFWFLKLNRKSFHHQPVTDYCEGPTRNSEYYWYPDLEMEALSLGWKPRGDKKNEVPWVRQDGGPIVEYQKQPVTPTEKRKAKDKERAVEESTKVVTPEKRRRRTKN